MSAPRLSADTKDAIAAAYVAGEKLQRIADRFGVHPSYPTILARRRGLAARPKRRPPPLAPTLRWVLSRARRRGVTDRAVARQKSKRRAAGQRETQDAVRARLAALDGPAKACFVRCRQGGMSRAESLSLAEDDLRIRRAVAA